MSKCLAKTDVKMAPRPAPPPPCKTTFPSPGRVHGNPGRVCKNNKSEMHILLWVANIIVSRVLLRRVQLIHLSSWQMSRSTTKPMKWRAPSETSDQPWHLPSPDPDLQILLELNLDFGLPQNFPTYGPRLGICPDWSETQTFFRRTVIGLGDLSLRWVYCHFVGFVLLRLKYNYFLQFSYHSSKRLPGKKLQYVSDFSSVLNITVMMCTFESGFCDLGNDKLVDDFDWLLGQYTRTPTTGPNGDHTFGHGLYRIDYVIYHS